MRLALGQINPCVGDLEGNVERCMGIIADASRKGADLVIMPEMAIPGCPPRDILMDSSFTDAVAEATADLAHRARQSPPTMVGTVMYAHRRSPDHPGLYNAAVLLERGQVRLVAAKRILPAHDVFYEPRWFLPGPALPPVKVANRSVGCLLSHDLCSEGCEIDPPAELIAGGADLLLCLAASPFDTQAMQRRLARARRHRCSLVYVNLCGASDELIFDGRSFVLDPEGELRARLAAFDEELSVIDLEERGTFSPQKLGSPEQEPQQELFQALVLGVRDFARKNRLERAFLGLSGGIDSALVACIAAEALDPSRVTAVAVPSRYTDPRSTSAAKELSDALGIQFEVVELEPLHAAAESVLGERLATGTAAENVQARARALVLMAFVNCYGGFLLNTSNKTEAALGYATLYGDTAGTLCPIADLTKLQVIDLARWYNASRRVIPSFVFDRFPTAELGVGQVDPFDYTKVSPEMEDLVLQNRSNLALRRSEHKRWQMGVILKVSEKAFGTGRLIPITRR